MDHSDSEESDNTPPSLAVLAARAALRSRCLVTRGDVVIHLPAAVLALLLRLAPLGDLAGLTNYLTKAADEGRGNHAAATAAVEHQWRRHHARLVLTRTYPTKPVGLRA